MPELLIRIKKKTDGAAALSCVRADGSTTWQRQQGKLGKFFPLHDLTHYVVETVFGFRRAFYGLLAEGWDISDFGLPERKPHIPGEATLVELIVGFFDLERATGERPTAVELNARIVSHYADRGQTTGFRMTEAQVASVRALRSELFDRWRALPAGETLQLQFDRRGDTAA
jgi:hypothetical protein